MAKDNGSKAEEPRGPTKRVVLRRENVLTIPQGTDPEKVVEAAKLLGLKGKITDGAEAWLVIGVFDGDSKTKAIEVYAGKPGTPDAKAGDYKAPPLSGWAGGERYKAPPRPLFEREPLEDVIAP